MATRIAKELRYEQILSRVQINEQYVVYTVLSSDGKSEYHTTVVAGVATGCDCPCQNGRCYHKPGVEAFERFHQAWEAPIAEPVVEETAPAVQPMTVAQAVLGKMAEDLEQHIEDEFTEDFASQAEAIIEAERTEQERIKEEKRKAFEAVCEQVKAIEAGVSVEQYRTLERTRYVLEQNRKQAEWRKARKEQAPLQPGNGVEETEFGMVPMRRAS